MSARRIALLRIAVIALAVTLLEALCRLQIIDPLTMVPPSAMAVGLAELLASGKATADILATARVVTIAIAASIVLGIVFGIWLHSAPRLKRAVAPLLTSYYAVPVFVFYPTLILIFGLNEIPLVIVGAMFAIVVMAINTMNGLDRVPRSFEKTARVLKLSPLQTVAWILIPSAFPYLIAGIKLAVAYCFIGVIAAEFILSTVGLGHAIAFAYNEFENRTMYALMLLVLGSVTTINLLLYAFEQRLRRRRERT